MALITPIALSQNAFDASRPQRFYFTSTGGDQVVKNKLTIRKQSDNSVVYSNIEETYSFYQDVPSRTLENGVYYNFYFNTYDFNGNISEDSNVVLFWCYTEPTIDFTNIPKTHIITTVSYNFQCVYNQIEGEKLESLSFKLYNNEGVLIDFSDTMYTTEVPPNVFEHTFDNLLEDLRYSIEVTGTTVNGTAITSGRLNFIVQYSEPIFYETLKLQNNANNGYINIYTNLIAIDGYSNKETPTLIDGAVDLSDLGDYVQWKSGFLIPSSFTMQILMKPCLLGNIMELKNTEGSLDVFVELKREIPEGEEAVKDCFYVRENNRLLNSPSCIRSNYVDIINNKSYLCLWIKKNGTVWDLKLEVLDRTDNIFNWNTVSNLEYNKLTDMSWGSEEYSEATDNIVINDYSGLYPLTDVKIFNGIFDNVYITKDTNIPYTSEPLTEWDNYTILHSNFGSGINAGNISVYVSQISKILIKRRAEGETSWVTIFEREIHGVEDININIYDYFSPNRTNMEYAICPVIDGAESSYIISKILSCFQGTYITDGNETYKLYESVMYASNKHSLRSGTHETLNGQYPIITYNSKLSYKSFAVEGMLLGYNFETTRKVDRNSVVKQTDAIVNFLTNKKQKIIKDWNGNICLGSVVDDATPTIDLINGFNKIAFNFVEQGKYNNQSDFDSSELIVK